MAHSTWQIPAPIEGPARVHPRWSDKSWWKYRNKLTRLEEAERERKAKEKSAKNIA